MLLGVRVWYQRQPQIGNTSKWQVGEIVTVGRKTLAGFGAIVCVAAVLAGGSGAAQASVTADIAQTKVIPGKNTYMAALFVDGRFTCGGSLVADDWIVTAKHCFRHTEPSSITVRVSSTKREAGGDVVGVTKVVLHPNSKVDLALLKLDQMVTGQQLKIGAPARAYRQGSKAMTLGWGKSRANASGYQNDLRWTKQEITSNRDCRGGAHGIFCAGRWHNAGSGTCTGDSGGPLVWGTDGIRKNGTPRGTAYILGTLRGLNNETCYRKGRNDDWQSVKAAQSWLKSVIAND